MQREKIFAAESTYSESNRVPFLASGCIFCDLLTGEREGAGPFWGMFGWHEITSAIVAETPHFAVVPDAAPIVEGHLLVLTKEHLHSIAHLSAAFYPKLEKILQHLHDVLSRHYSAPIVLEHGAASAQQRAGCCVDHAHLHIVPVTVDLMPFLEPRFVKMPLRDFHDLQAHFRGRPYLLVVSATGAMFGFDAPICPSQFHRQLLAVTLGYPSEWDWRQGIKDEARRAIYKERIARLLSKVKSELVMLSEFTEKGR